MWCHCTWIGSRLSKRTGSPKVHGSFGCTGKQSERWDRLAKFATIRAVSLVVLGEAHNLSPFHRSVRRTPIRHQPTELCFLDC